MTNNDQSNFGPWKMRFFTIWTGQAFSLFGSSLVSFALIWWLTLQTGSETILATATLVSILPHIVLGPFAGTYIDRWNRRKVMIIADASTALLTALLVFLFWQGIAEPWHIFVVMFLRELGGTFQQPAMMASTSLMVPKEHLARVGGMNQTLNGLLRIIAPPSGAFLISILPMNGVLAVDLITACIAIGSLLFVSIPQPEPSDTVQKESSLLRETMDGLRFVWDWRPLFLVVATCTLANIFLGATRSFMPLLVTREFGGDALQLSYVSVAVGIGIITGGFVMSLWGGFKRKLITSGIGWIGVGIGYMVVTFLPGSGFAAFLLVMGLVGFMVPVGGAPLTAFYQTCVPPDKQGRVFAVLTSIDNATLPLGLIIAAILGGLVPVRFWYFLVGASHALLGISWLFLPFIRDAEKDAVEERSKLTSVEQNLSVQ